MTPVGPAVEDSVHPCEREQVVGFDRIANGVSGNELAGYNPLEPRRDKPDIFAPETLAETVLEGWLKDTNVPGTSIASYWLTAAALLVWATMPERDPAWVKATLLDTTDSIIVKRFRRFQPRALNMSAALDRARDDLVLANLPSGHRVSLVEVLASVGLPGLVTDGALRRLVDSHKIELTITESGEYYQLA